ncbi:MAG: dihydrodipicolinate synthase family protein [Rhizobiaceae bacterium]
MTKSKPLRGVIAAIATPLDANGAPDAQRFIALANHLLGNGCDGLNMLGTTGEATSFTTAERIALMEAVAASGLDLSRLMVGTGAAATGDAVRLTGAAAALGFAGALVLPPFYYKGVPDAGIVAYFGPIAAVSAALPLYLYNFPAMSGIAYSPVLVRALMAELPGRIAGLKDSSGDLAYAREIAEISADLSVFPSNEAVLLDARRGDFAGCISATANLNAALCARAFHEGDEDALEKAVAIRALFDGKALVPGVKAVLAHIHDDDTLARTKPPLVEASSDEKAALSAAYDRIAEPK